MQPYSPRPEPSAAAHCLDSWLFAIGLVVSLVLLCALEDRKTWEDRYPAAPMQLYGAADAAVGQVRGEPAHADRHARAQRLPSGHARPRAASVQWI